MKTGSARTLVLSAALTGAALASLPWLVHGYYDPQVRTGDGAIYLLTARSLLNGEGYRYLGEPFVIRPPGFSVLLLPVLALFGDDMYAVNFYVSMLGAIGVGLLFAFYQRRLGTWVAAAVSLAAWLNPAWRELSNQVMSDVPGVTVLFGCLLLERWADARLSTRRDVMLGIGIGLAAYVRSIAILLAPAVVVGAAWPASRSRHLREVGFASPPRAGCPCCWLAGWCFCRGSFATPGRSVRPQPSTRSSIRTRWPCGTPTSRIPTLLGSGSTT